MSKPLQNTVQVAELLQIQAQTLYFWRTIGKGPRYIKMGTLVRYRPCDVEAWIDAQQQVATKS